MTPGQHIAAAVCWLERRWHAQLPSTEVNIEGQVRYWHPKRCGFCDVPLDELIARVEKEAPSAEAMSDFRRLSQPARAARIREAQEVDWWTELPAPNSPSD